MECIFHIGFHKTGTASLQALLDANRARLGEGVALVNHGSPAMRRLNRACARFERRRSHRAGRMIANDLRWILRAVANLGFTKVILSSPGLCGPLPTPGRKGRFYEGAAETVTWLQKGADEHHASFHLYLRDEAAWRASLRWHFGAMQGRPMPEAAFDALPGLAGFSLQGVADEIATVAPGLQRYRMEEDLGARLGPGKAFLHRIGYDDIALEDWQPVPRPVPDPALIAALNHPLIRLLPEPLRCPVARWRKG